MAEDLERSRMAKLRELDKDMVPKASKTSKHSSKKKT